jgi:hypothetical protein
VIKDPRGAMRSFVLADTAIAAVIGTRYYPEEIDPGERRPSIVYTLIYDATDYTYGGASGLIAATWQFVAYATDRDTAFDLANLIKNRLSGFRGNMVGQTVTIAVRGVFAGSGQTGREPDTGFYSMRRDYRIIYLEQ